MTILKKIYIIISKTTTVLARVIRFILKTEYSHVSISLDDSCDNMISFGRKVPWNPFNGGLVDEGKNIGFFKHFKKTNVVIFEIDISDKQYIKLSNLIESFKQKRSSYSFNIMGMSLASMSIPYGKENKYFCSQFVAHLLKEAEIHDFNKDNRLVRPHDFASIKNAKEIYKGIISEYVKK